MTKRGPDAKQAPCKPATAIQAGLAKGLFDELAKGFNCAARSLTALDEQEHLTLLSEAEIAYQNALCLVQQAGIVPGSPTAQRLQQLGNFLQIQDTLQEGH